MVTKLTNSSSCQCDDWYWPAVWGHAMGLGYYFIEVFPAGFDKMFRPVFHNFICISYVTLILRLHYVPGSPGSPVCSKRIVSRNLVIYFSVFKIYYVLLSFLTLYYDIRNKPW